MPLPGGLGVYYPGELDNAESAVMAEMVHLREGMPVYAPASTERFDSVLYGPLFYLLCSRLIDPARPNHILPRGLSLLATVGLAASCSLLAFWLARSYLAAAIASRLVSGIDLSPTSAPRLVVTPWPCCCGSQDFSWLTDFKTAGGFCSPSRS